MNALRQSVPRPSAIAAGVFHLPLGPAADAWILHDGHYECDAARDCAWNAAPPDVAKALAAAGLGAGPLRLNVLPLLLRWHGEYVLIDPGCGTAYGPGLGWVGERLRSLNVMPDAIRQVMFSHLHLDHIAGTIDAAAGRVLFPQARYWASRREFAFWGQARPDLSQTKLSRDQQSGVLAKIKSTLEILGPKLDLFEPESAILPGIRAVSLPGHTTGHVGFEIETEIGELAYVGDALVEPTLHVPHPDWLTAGDSMPERVEATRKTLLARAIERGQWLLGYHFPLPGIGTIRADSTGQISFQCARWDWAPV